MEALSYDLGRPEPLPPPIPDRGVLYLAPPRDHTGSSIRALLRRHRLPFADAAGGVLAIRLPSGELRRLCANLGEALSAAALQDTRSLLKDSTRAPGLADLALMEPLALLVGRVRSEWLVDMLREDRLLVHFQSVVRCADPGELIGHECLLRGLERDGTLVHHVHLARAASDAGLSHALDRSARLAAVRSAASHRLPGLVFVNVDPASIYDPAFDLQSTVRAVSDGGLAPDRIVLELPAESAAGDLAHLQALASAARRAGFQVAIDGLGSGHGSFGLVARLRPDAVKLGLDLVRSVLLEPAAASTAERVIEVARGSGAFVVATGVETEDEWRFFRDRGVDCAQGYLFARPAAEPPDAGFIPS